jgi:hypothetical protein
MRKLDGIMRLLTTYTEREKVVKLVLSD